MNYTEQQIAEALEGKFFWAQGSYGDKTAIEESREIINAQKQFRVKPKPVKKEVVVVEKPPKVTGYGAKIAVIRDSVAKMHGVDPERLIKRGRTKDIIWVRHHFIWSITRYLPRLSVSEAGRRLGKNHTTLLHSRDLFESVKARYAEEISMLDAALMGIEES